MLGAHIAEKINPNILKRLFGILLLAAALRMTIFSAVDSLTTETSDYSTLVTIGLGTGSGLIAGLLGVGGSIVLVPGSVLLLGSS